MSELILTKTRLADGRWQGRLTGAAPGSRPRIEVRHLDLPLPGVTLDETADPGSWDLLVPIPPHAIADGVHTFVILDAATATRLGEFCLIAGDAASSTLQAELDLLRAELDMLKRAFRRHCQDSAHTHGG